MADKHKYGFILMLIALIAGTFACEEQTDWDFEGSASIMVVDALITNELKPQHISITTTTQQLNETPVPISHVVVELSDGDSSYIFQESELNPGHYYSEAFRAFVGKRYRLTIAYKNLRDTAVAEMVGVSKLNELKTQKLNRLYKYSYTGSILPAITEVYYDWAAIDTFCTYYGACSAMETYYSLESIDINEQFGPDKQEILFPKGTKIVRRKYSLSDAHQEFIRSLLIETEWRGGLFDVEQGNVPTNFKHGTRGWFATCMVLSDSLIVQ